MYLFEYIRTFKLFVTMSYKKNFLLVFLFDLIFQENYFSECIFLAFSYLCSTLQFFINFTYVKPIRIIQQKKNVNLLSNQQEFEIKLKTKTEKADYPTTTVIKQEMSTITVNKQDMSTITVNKQDIITTTVNKQDPLVIILILITTITMIIMILGVACYIFRKSYRRRAETGSHKDADKNVERTETSLMREPTNTIPTEGNRKFTSLRI